MSLSRVIEYGSVEKDPRRPESDLLQDPRVGKRESDPISWLSSDFYIYIKPVACMHSQICTHKINKENVIRKSHVWLECREIDAVF